MTKKQHIIFTGTTSNAGKTFLTGFIGKILKDKFQMNVAPFKAQNMSNYAIVCETNKEISIAQAMQAEMMNLTPIADMNPILLKVLGDSRSEIILRGIPNKITDARSYYQDIESLKPYVDMSFENMKSNYDTILIEGAGSAFELNLKERDLANQYIMNKNNVYNVLIANIENGGVFPSIIGSKLLMSEEQKHRFRGVIINNFRGDITLFDEGVKILEDEYNIPVIGVIPNIPYGLDVEDSLSLMYSSDKKKVNLCNIGIIKYPHASNMNDIEPLVHDPNVSVSYINQKINLEIFDCVILPGSRSVIDDLRWLKSTGLFDDLQTTKTNIYGICGGYQMMHQKINDPLGSESSQKISQSEDGLGFIPGQIEFKKNKILLRKDFKLFDGIMVHGFEMHTGISDSNPMFYQSKNISGSIVHEIFHCDNFRRWWIQKISKIKPKLWDYRSWKKQVQNNVAEIIMDKLDFEKLLGKNL